MQQSITLNVVRPIRAANDAAAPVLRPRVLEVLETMQETVDHDARWLLLGFVEAICRLDRVTHGFGAEDIKTVVQGWEGYDGSAWDGGFVVDLQDGRRACLSVLAVGFDWELESEIRAAFVEPGFDHRADLIQRYGDTGYAYETKLPALQELLRRLAAH